MKDLRKNVCSDMNSVIDCLLQHSSIPHPEFESVKLYGNSAFIIETLKCIVCDYPSISIASIEIVSNEIDPVENDLYVLSITEEYELFIQSAYNGYTLFANEAKFVICQKDIFSQVIDIFEDNITVKVYG